MVDSQGQNLTKNEFAIMDHNLKELGWEFDFSEENAKTKSPLAIQDGDVPLTDVAWSKLSEIIVKLTVVEKEGQKVYKQLKELPLKNELCQRQLNELEDCLMNLDDEKNKLDKVYKYRKGQDRAVTSGFESGIFVITCLQTNVLSTEVCDMC